MTDFSGKVAIVTGAARGQGREMALELARAGADLGICDVGQAAIPSVDYALGGALGEVAAEIEALGRRVVHLACDVRDQTQIDAFVGAVTTAFGRVDIVVNNAGILTGNKPVHELDDRTWATTLDVNLTAIFRMSRAVVPGMIARKQGGRIINIASVAGLIGTPNYGHYCASKHGVIGLTKTMAAELGAHGITVNAICPGLVDTKMVEHSTSEVAERAGITQEAAYDAFLSVHLIKERITPAQTAAAMLYLASDAARVVTGSALAIDAGWSVT